MRAHTKGKDKMGKRFAIVIGVAAAGVMALGAQTAAATTFDTKLTLTKEGCCPNATLYHGMVLSDRDRNPEFHGATAVKGCMVGRHVALFKRRRGADRKLGGDLSVFHEDHADWSVEIPRQRPDRDLYARVRPKVLRNGNVCRADRDGHLSI